MGLDKWLEDMKNDVVSVAFSIDKLSWDEVEKKYSERTGLTEPKTIVWGLMSAYMTGNLFDDKEMAEAAKKILQVKISDLEERLPWYEVMFNIMDKGNFCDGTDYEAAGPYYFRLQPDDHNELSDYLVEKTNLDKDNASWAVQRLSKEMAYMPGAQYDSYRIFCPPEQHRARKIAIICRYLHLPMSAIITVRNEDRVADFFYESITKRLNPQLTVAEKSI